MIKKIRDVLFASKKRKIISISSGVIILLCFYWLFSGDSSSTKYVLGTVKKETIVTSIEGSGQISSLNEISLKTKSSGDILVVNGFAGKEVKAGDVILQIGAKDALKDLRDAEIAYDSARLSLDKLKLEQSHSVTNDSQEIKDAYHKLLNSTFEAYEDDEKGVSQLESPVISGDYSLGKEGIITIRPYVSVGGYAYKAEGLVNCTGMIVSGISKPICDSGLFIKFSTEKGYAGSTWVISIPNKLASDYFSNKSTYDSLILKQKQKIKDEGGSDYFDLRSKEIEVTQKYNALQDAREKLADYSVIAPFDGVVTSFSAKKFDNISSGTSVGTLSTKNKIAIISLNEVDVSKVKIGQKANLTFDAIDSLNISGQVTEVDSVGTVSQGVVSYNVKISLDTDDERIKPGMTVSSSIILEVRPDVLSVQNNAIKSDNEGSYVEVIEQGGDLIDGAQIDIDLFTPVQKAIEVGISNDTVTEIVSGLVEGEKVIVRTITSTINTSKTSTAPSLFGSMGGTRGGATGSRTLQR